MTLVRVGRHGLLMALVRVGRHGRRHSHVLLLPVAWVFRNMGKDGRVKGRRLSLIIVDRNFSRGGVLSWGRLFDPDWGGMRMGGHFRLAKQQIFVLYKHPKIRIKANIPRQYKMINIWKCTTAIQSPKATTILRSRIAKLENS